MNILDPNSSIANFFNGGGNALLLHTDANINGTGVMIRKGQPSFSAFVGNQALQFTNTSTTTSATNQLDLVGLAPADGSAHFVNGSADYDQSDSSSPVPVLDASIAGSFVSDTSNPGRLTGSFTIPTPATAGAYPFISASAPSFNVSHYQINGSQTFVLQTDSSANISGYLIRQLFH